MKKLIAELMLCAIALFICGCGADINLPDSNITNEYEADNAVNTKVDGPIMVEIETIEENKEVAIVDREVKYPIRVAVLGSPAADILEMADKCLHSSEYGIEVVRCSSVEEANDMVLEGKVQASLVANQVYIESYNFINESDLVIVERVYLNPLALFPGRVNNLDNITNGEKIAVASGEINVARALYLLSQKGIITVKDGALYRATVEDITSNPHNISFVEVNMDDGWPEDGQYGLIIADYNRAIVNGIDPYTALTQENRNSELVDYFAICLVAKEKAINSKEINYLMNALNSDEVEDALETQFMRSVYDYK